MLKKLGIEKIVGGHTSQLTSITKSYRGRYLEEMRERNRESALKAYHVDKTSGLLEKTEGGWKNISQTDKGRERLAAQGKAREKKAYHVNKTSNLLEKTEDGWMNVNQTKEGRERVAERAVAMQRASVVARRSKSTALVCGKVPTGKKILKCNYCGWVSDPIDAAMKIFTCAGRCGGKRKYIHVRSGKHGSQGVDYERPSKHWTFKYV